jgi:poly-gamma-glutamate capsule biosynthesis protein CapA/YwtB (metallophosphatase superfamily)
MSIRQLGKWIASGIALLLLASGCSISTAPEQPMEPVQEKRLEPAGGTEEHAAPPQPSAPPPPAEATMLSVGDIMMHTPQLPGAYDEDSGTYDFSNFFIQVRSRVKAADWSFANLETPIAGDERGFKGYPLFNAPTALADALADAGFDIISTANNHALDQGYDGLVHTLETLRAKGLIPVGTADSEEAAKQIPLVEKNGIVNAFLAFTYGTNGIPVPKDKPYAVHLIDEENMAEQIQQARALGADVVSVSLHFGNEYQRQPSEEQRSIARGAILAGADVVLGHHPHVVQPYEWFRAETEDGEIREGLIIYSHGNFISNQFGDYKEYGAIFEVTFRKTYLPDGTAETKITAYDATPTWVHKYVSGGKNRYRVLPLDDTDALANDSLLTARLASVLTQRAAELDRHIHSFMSTEQPPSVPVVTDEVYRSN